MRLLSPDAAANSGLATNIAITPNFTSCFKVYFNAKLVQFFLYVRIRAEEGFSPKFSGDDGSPSNRFGRFVIEPIRSDPKGDSPNEI